MSARQEAEGRQWAYETFGGAKVGSCRRLRRLVDVATTLARRPAGTVTGVFDDSADREGAYRLLSNPAVSAQELTRAMSAATARRCTVYDRVYVPIDGSSLSLQDHQGRRDVGGVGSWNNGGRGLQVVTALALDPEGTPIGVCAQTWWARPYVANLRRNDRRKLPEKETRYALETVSNALEHLKAQCPDTLAIAVMDRGFDCWPVLRTAAEGAHFIVRAHQDRRVANGPRGEFRYLRDTLRAQPIRGRYDAHVPSRAGRPARIARMQVRAVRVTLRLPVTRKRIVHQELNALWAQEVGGGLSWMLLTTEPIETFQQVLEIVRAYVFRWRIEEVHRAWKRGGGHVEGTQLRSRDAIIKWATLHAAVATRAVRLAQLARTQPEISASQEFTQTEIDAVIVLRRKRTRYKLGDVPSLGELVRMIADAGGYTGKSSGGPPGPTVIGRGLERLGMAAEVLEALRK